MLIEQIIVLLLCFGCACIILLLYNHFKKHDTICNESTEVTMSLNSYNNIVSLLKELNRLVSLIKEINILIEKDVEIYPCVLADTKEHKSSEYLTVLKQEYLNQLGIEYMFFKDVYLGYKDCFPAQSKRSIDNFSNSVQVFLDDNYKV